MNWLQKIAGPAQKIQRFRVQSPSVQSFIYKYERLVPWNDVTNEQDIQTFIAQQILPNLYAQINPESENNVYTKNINVEQEIQQNPNNPQLQQAYRTYQQNPEQGQQTMLNAINGPKQETFGQWYEYLTSGNDVYKNDPAFQYVTFAPLIKAYGEKTKQIPLSLNADSLSRVYESLNENPQINVLKQYSNFLRDENISSLSPGQTNTEHSNGWVRIPSKTNDPENFQANVARLKDLSCGNGWCTAGGMAKPYLSEGDFWLLMKNRRAVVAVRLAGNEVQEIQGTNNNLPIHYFREITSFLQNSNFDYERSLHYQNLQKGFEVDEYIKTRDFEALEKFVKASPQNILFLSPEQLNNPEINQVVLNSLNLEDIRQGFNYAKAKQGQNVPPEIIQGIARNPKYSYNYANEVLGWQNVPPEIMQGIASSSSISHQYAGNVLKGKNVPPEIVQSIASDPFVAYEYAGGLKWQNVPPKIMQSIASDPHTSYRYANTVLKGQNVPPEIIQGIARKPSVAHGYAKDVLKWQNVPPEILQSIAGDSQTSYNYANDVLKGQNVPPEFVRGIASYSTRAYEYAKNVLNWQNVPPEIMQSIANTAETSYNYANEVLEWQNVPPEIIQSLIRNSRLAFNYANEVLGWQNVPPEVIQSLIREPIGAYNYAKIVLKGQNIPPEIIQGIASDPHYAFGYASGVLKGQNVPPEIIQSLAEYDRFAFQYASTVLNWQNVPPEIMQSINESKDVADYGFYSIMSGHNIPPEFMQMVLSNPEYAYKYASEVLKGQNVPPEVIQGIARNPEYAYEYANKVLKGQNVPPEIMQSIASDPEIMQWQNVSPEGQNVPPISANNFNWLQKIANHDELTNHTDFIGYHCQQSEYFDGEIINDNNYAASHYPNILEAIPFDLRDKAYNLNLLNYPDQYDDNFELWAEQVHDFLWENGIRWIYVSTRVPLGGNFTSRPGAVYGDHCYYVLLPDNAVLDVIDDINVNDIAYAYLYNSKIASPQLVPIAEDQEFEL